MFLLFPFFSQIFAYCCTFTKWNCSTLFSFYLFSHWKKPKKISGPVCSYFWRIYFPFWAVKSDKMFHVAYTFFSSPSALLALVQSKKEQLKPTRISKLEIENQTTVHNRKRRINTVIVCFCVCVWERERRRR